MFGGTPWFLPGPATEADAPARWRDDLWADPYIARAADEEEFDDDEDEDDEDDEEEEELEA